MSNIDKRIVQMQFDNKQFEEGIKTSTNSLDNLKDKLKMEGASQGLSNLEKAGKNFSLAGISNNVDAIASKFSALSVIGITALANLTNSAVNAGKQMLKSLTIDPVMEGYQDYMRKITSIQTITNATGKSIKEVEAYFSQLDTYADKTIYNLDDMTSALAKFTNAGVSMDKSVPAIKGIANMVALAGQDAGAAQIAFYNLSQSIAGGFLTTTDYKSLNLANVATKEWKEQMIQGAIAAGTLKKNSKNMYLIKGQKQAITEAALFNEELSKGWATTAVMLDVFGKYGNEQTAIGKKALAAAQDIKSFGMMMETLKAQVGTGWTDTFEILIGNLDESKALFTPLTNVIGAFLDKTAQARNTVLAFWKANGGRDALIKSVVNAFEALNAILKPVHDAFREIFPPATGQGLVTFSKALQSVTEHLKIGAGTASALKLSFKGLFAVIDMGFKVIKLLADGLGLLVKLLLPGVGGLGDGLLYVTSSIGNFLVYLNDSIDKSGIMTKALEGMSKGFTITKEFIKDAIVALGPTMTSVIDGLKRGITKLSEVFDNLFGGTKVLAKGVNDNVQAFAQAESGTNRVRQAFEGIRTAMIKVKDVFVAIGKGIAKIVIPIFDSIKKKFDEFSMQDFGALLTGGGLLMVAKTLSKGLNSVNDIIGNFANVIGQVGDTLKAFQLKIKAEALMKVAISLGILAASIVALSLINGEALAKALIALAGAMTILVVAMKLMNKTSKGLTSIIDVFGKLGDMFSKIGTAIEIIAFATGMLILAGALKIISSIEPAKLIQGTVAIGALLAMISLFIKTTKSGSLKDSAGGLTGFAIGIAILAESIAILGKMDTNKLTQGTIAIADLMAIIMLFINLTRGGDLKASASGLIAFSTGITILAGALSILGNIHPDKLKQGTLAIAELMTVIMLFINLTRGGDLKASASGLIGFSIGLTILIGSLAILANMNIGNLIQGTVAITTVMTVIPMFINITRGGDLKASASGLIGFALGITILVKALSVLANMKTSSLIQGTIAISALMAVISTFIVITSGSDLKKSSTGIIGFAIGLTILAEALKILGDMKTQNVIQGTIAISALISMIAMFVNLTKAGDLEKSAKGLIGFSTGLMILAGVIAILSALNPQKLMMASMAIAALITSIGLFVSLTKAGDLKKSAVGLTAFAIGIGVLAVSLVAIGQMDTGKIVAAGGAITVLLLSIIAFINLTKAGDLILSAAGLVVFSGALMILSNVITTLGSVDIKTLAIGIGALALMLVTIGLTSAVLAPLTPVILGLSAAIVLFGLGCLEIGAGMYLFSQGLSNLAVSGKDGAQALADAIIIIIGLIPLALTTLAKGIIDFAKTIGDGAPVIAESFVKIVDAIVLTATNSIPRMVDAGMRLILGILTGIANNIAKVVAAGIDVIIQFILGISSKLPAIIDTAFKVIISFINGLADAIRNNHNAIYSACNNLIDAIINAIVDLIPNIVSAGVNVIRGFIRGLSSMDKAVHDAMNGIVNGAVDGVKRLLGIHSPSTVFAEIGKYSALGFAVGLDNYSSIVSNKAMDVGNTAMDSLRYAMSNASDIISNNIDSNPTIRPVLDLTNVTNGVGTINSLLSRNNGLTVSTSSIKAASISSAMQPVMADVQNGSNVQPKMPDTSGPRPVSLQLVLQNGAKIAEYLIDDFDSLMGNKNQVSGRMVGI